MQFAELTDSVLTMTVRPDKEDLARQKINAVLRTISISGTFWPDLVEETLSDHPDWQSDSNIQTLALPDRFRKPAYIERDLSQINITTGRLESRQTHGIAYNRITPRTTRKEGREIRNAYYMSGKNLLLRQEVAGEAVIWGYYAFQPRLINPDDSNWITELMPDLIIDWASQFLMASLGDRDRTNGLAALAQLQLSVFVDEMLTDTEASVEVGR